MIRAWLAAVVALALVMAPRHSNEHTMRLEGGILAATRDPLAPSVAGTVGGLYPGLSTSVAVVVKNKAAYAIHVTAIRATVANATTACTAGNMTVTPFQGSVRVGARAQATISLPVAMARSATDACRGAAFPITYTATYTRG